MPDPDDLRVWRMDEGGETHWLIAETIAEAIAVAVGTAVESIHVLDNVHVRAMRDDEPITIDNDDTGQSVTLTAREWITKTGKPDILATTAR